MGLFRNFIKKLIESKISKCKISKQEPVVQDRPKDWECFCEITNELLSSKEKEDAAFVKKKLALTVSLLGEDSMPSTLPLIIDVLDEFNVVKGCVALLGDALFWGREKIDRANDQLRQISPLFDFVVILRCEAFLRKQYREVYSLDLISSLKFFYKIASSLCHIIYNTSSLKDVETEIRRFPIMEQLFVDGVLSIIWNTPIDSGIENSLVIGLGDTGYLIADDIYNLHLENLETLGLGIGLDRKKNSPLLDLRGDENYFSEIDQSDVYCNTFVEMNIDLIKDVIEYLLGFDVSHQSETPYWERIR